MSRTSAYLQITENLKVCSSFRVHIPELMHRNTHLYQHVLVSSGQRSHESSLIDRSGQTH
jgi:hypothetical protein